MKKITDTLQLTGLTIILVILTLLTADVTAQKKAASPALPDINKLMKMNPAVLVEAYKKQMLNDASKQAKQISAQYNLKIDETTLPDFELKPPVKDSKHLALIPTQAPTLIQLTEGLKKSKQQLEAATSKAILDEVKSITAQQTPSQMQSASIAEFYRDKPIQALLVSMQSAIQNINEVTVWNNLAAIYNMTGLQHKAIPVLMHHLQNLPTNSMLLNNMGQAYLGLGDLAAAKKYLQQCLVQDPLNPEANRSMGMICLFQKEYDESKQYFEKELEVTQRKSTIELVQKNGFAINIYLVRKKRTGIPHQDFFGDIQLGKFHVPEFPKTSGESRMVDDKHGAFRQSVSKEMLYWLEKGNASPALLAEEGKEWNGPYAWQVKELLHDLHEIYNPDELALFDDIQIDELKKMTSAYGEQMAAVKCPEPPVNATMAVTLAYQQKCCELKRPIIDAFIAQYNAFVMMRINVITPVWKAYLNDLINIVSLDPTSANKRYVSHIIMQYFSYLAFASQSGVFIDPPAECNTNLTKAQADSIIESSRDIDLHCPKWLNMELDLQIGKIKADCSKYSLEGGELFRAGYEHNFKTGTSTLSAGVGVKAKFFLGAAGADIKQMVYVSFDNNGEFSDFGLKGGVSIKLNDSPSSISDGIIKVGTTVAGVEGGYTLGINSGFNPIIQGKGIIADF